MSKKYDWIIFDLGGVLALEDRFDRLNLDWGVRYCQERGFAISIDEASTAWRDCPLGSYPDRMTYALEHLGIPEALAWEAGEKLYRENPQVYYDALFPNAALLGMLGELRGSVRLCIAANQHRQVATWLEHSGLPAYVDESHFDFELGASKPSTDFFTQLANVLHTLPQQCIYVGDRVDNDVVPALRSGMTPVRFRGTGEYSCQSLEVHGVGVAGVPEAGNEAALRSILLSLIAHTGEGPARRAAITRVSKLPESMH